MTGVRSGAGGEASRRGGSVRSRLGLLRSLVIYYGAPFKIRRLAKFLLPFVRPGDLCFDVGAHVGDRTRALRRLGATVVAIEPQPGCLDVLRRLYGNDSGVIVVDAAVGEAEGEATLLISERTPTVSSTSPEWVEGVQAAPRFLGVAWDGRATVRLTTLDALIAHFGRPAFCKLDVEGSELAALTGLSQPIPVVAFEYIPVQRKAAQACLTRLETLAGYEYNWTEREVPRFRSSEWVSAEVMRAWLNQVPDGAHSGDVFACLKKEGDSGKR